MQKFLTQKTLCLLVTLTLCLFVGCNSKRGLIPVSGQVKIDGKPLEAGSVVIWVKDYRPAVGKVGKDGRFIIKTSKQGDGCVAGEHIVTVLGQRTLKGDAMEFLIPERYGDPEKSGLKIKVDEPNENWNIVLTWKGDAHSAPYIVK